MSIQKRNPATCIVLFVITCGLYGYYWVYKISEDLDQLEGTTSSAAMDMLACFLTCFLFLIFCGFKWSKQVNAIKQRYGMDPGKEHSLFLMIICVVLPMLGWVYNLCFIQDSLNEILDRIAAPAPGHGTQN